MVSKAQVKLSRSVSTIQYASTVALEQERARQLSLGRKQSLKLLDAIESELSSRKSNNGRRPTIEDMLGY